jgi:hypothetical protein
MSVRFSALDRRLIRQLKPGEKASEHGITVERLTDGDLRYEVGVMVDGKRIHRVIGKASDGVTAPSARNSSRPSAPRRAPGAWRCPKGASWR